MYAGRTWMKSRRLSRVFRHFRLVTFLHYLVPLCSKYHVLFVYFSTVYICQSYRWPLVFLAAHSRLVVRRVLDADII